MRSLLFLLLMTGLTAVLLRSKSVQTYLAQYGSRYLEKELGCKVRIKSVDFDLFQNLRLEGVFISDQQGDTMIAADGIIAGLSNFDNVGRNIKLHDLILVNAFVNLGHYKGISGTNIDFLVDFINGPPKKRTGPSRPWKIYAANARLVNVRFHYFDERGADPEPGLLDEYHLQFSSIHGLCRDFWIIQDSLTFDAVNWTFKERSGLRMESFNSVCRIYDKGMDFNSLSAITPSSVLLGELHFRYPGFKYLDEFIHNTQWLGQLKDSKIALKELSIFNESLKGHPEVLYIDADISGTYDKLRLRNVDASIGNHTRLKGNLFFDGLPDWRTTYCQFETPLIQTTADGLRKLLNNQDLPELMDRFGQITWGGSFTGQFLDFKLVGDLKTNAGNFRTDAFLNFKEGVNKATYAGTFQSDGFDLTVLPGLENFGTAVFNIQAEGSGLNAESFNLKTEADIASFQLSGRTFENTIVNGELTSKTFKGEAFFNDTRLNASLNGSLDFSTSQPEFRFLLSSKGTDLYEIGADTLHTIVIGDIDVNWLGLDLADAEGQIVGRNIVIQRDGEIYQYANQSLVKSNYTNGSRIEFTGEFANGNIQGNFNPSRFVPIGQNILASVMSNRFKPVQQKGKDSFLFTCNIPDPALLTSFIDKKISLTGLNFNGFYNSADGSMRLAVEPLDVCYGSTTIRHLALNGRKDDSVKLNLRLFASGLAVEDSALFSNLEMKGEFYNNKADFELKMANTANNEEIDLIAESRIYPDSIGMNLGKSKLNLYGNEWVFEEQSGITVIGFNRIRANNLYLKGKDFYLELNGMLSALKTDSLKIDFGNFTFENIKPFVPRHSLDSLTGVLNGTMFITSVFNNPGVWGDIAARRLKYYGVEYGDLNLSLNDAGKGRRLGLQGDFIRGPLIGLSAIGTIEMSSAATGDQFDLDFRIPPSTSLKLVQPFMEDILTVESGFISGKLHLGGSTEKPRIGGSVNLENGKILIDYLKTKYTLSADFIANDKGFFTAKPVKIVDETGKGTAVATMSITHKDFGNWFMDLRIDSARNLKAMNTTEKDNSLYYGTGYADGSCRIYGPFDRISMDIKLKTKKNTQLYLLYSDVEQNTVGSFFKFRDHLGKSSGKELKKTESSIYRINIELEVTPDAEAQFVIDKRLGDIIKGRGTGNLRMLYDENQQFFLYGSFAVSEGDYVFSLPGINVLTRKIALDKGGTISWDGDPFNAMLNMTGSFEKKISPSALMYSVSNSGNKNYPATRVVSQLIMKGNLFSPEISFDIQVPDLQSQGGAASSDVYSVIQRIRTDKDETMRQAVSLLLFGNFIPPTFAQNAGAGIISGSGVAGNSLSGIASSVVNDIFTKLGIPTRIQVNIDDVRSTSGTNTKVFISSEWFLTERLRLDLNYDPTVAMVVSNVALPLNFNLEYMTRNENWRVKAFSRSNNLLLQQNNTTVTNGVSGNTIGGGVVYRREFNTFRNKKPKTENSAPK